MANAKFDAFLKQSLPSHDLRKVMAAIKQRVSWWNSNGWLGLPEGQGNESGFQRLPFHYDY